MAADSADADLEQQTDALGQTLRAMMEQDALAQPSDLASGVFAEWLAAAGPASLKPELFVDVAQNYVVQDNTNKDLFDLFLMLAEYIEFEPEQTSLGTFIGLPMA